MCCLMIVWRWFDDVWWSCFHGHWQFIIKQSGRYNHQNIIKDSCLRCFNNVIKDHQKTWSSLNDLFDDFLMIVWWFLMISWKLKRCATSVRSFWRRYRAEISTMCQKTKVFVLGKNLGPGTGGLTTSPMDQGPRKKQRTKSWSPYLVCQKGCEIMSRIQTFAK